MKRKLRHLAVERLADRRMLAGDIAQVGFFDTWDGGIIRSTDVAGIAYHAPSGHLFLADSEINELPNIFLGDNIFETSLTGDQVLREYTSNNTEPTGITYNEYDGYFYVTNDTGSRQITRYDDNLNTPLLQVSTRTAISSANDPEGITSDPATGYLYVADGNGGGRQVLVYDSNLQFQYNFPVGAQMNDAEGIAFHTPSRTLFLVDGSQDMIFQYTLDGVFLDNYNIHGFSPSPKAAQGLTFGPTSDPFDDPANLSLYIADGMKDNYPDGGVFEAQIGNVAPPGNVAPTTSGIADVYVNVGAADSVIDLFSAFDDFEDPDTSLSYTLESNSNPSLFTSTSIDGVLGTLTLDYVAGMTGSADLTLRATDTGTPPLYVETTFRVTVAPVNQPPTTTGIGDVTVAEDSSATLIDLFAAFDDAEDSDSSLVYTLQNNTNPGLFSSTLINGAVGQLTLSYTPDATGSSALTVRATDHGVPSLYAEATFNVNVTEVNDVPVQVSGSVGDLTVVQNSPATPLGLSGLAYGPGGGTDEASQSLSYEVTAVPSSTLGSIVLADGSTLVTPGVYSLSQLQGMQFLAAGGVFGGPEGFAFRVTDNGTTNGIADFQSLDQSLQIDVIEYLPDPIVVDVQVGASSDDAEERPSGNVALTSSDLELTLDKTNQQVVGMRFAGVAIPPGAVIQRASIQFQTDEVSSDVTSLTIRGEATSNAQTFIATNYNVTTRPRTTAAVAWAPAPWLITGEAGPDQQTPDLASVIQEIVNGPGWSSGNALSIIIDGTGKRVAESYDGVASAAPRLHIEYLPGNVAPTTSGIADVYVNVGAADSVIDLFSAFDDFEDPDTSLSYTLESNSNPSLFTSTSIDGVLGTLTLDYVAGMTGSADLTLRATDTGTPPLYVETTFRVTVAPVNQPPTTTGIGDVTVAEDSSATLIDLFAAFDDAEDSDSSLVYTLQNNTNPGLFSSTLINGAVGQLTLSYTPDATGSSALTVRATDHGVPSLYAEATFNVNVTEVNDVPVQVSGSVGDLTVVQNSPATPLGLSGLAYGPGGGTDEASQSLSYEVTAVPSSTLGSIVLADGSTLVTPGVYSLSQLQGMQFLAAGGVFGGPEGFAFRVTDNGTTNGIADFQSLDQSLQIDVIEYLPDPIVVDVQVGASSDDAEERPSGNVALTSSDLELTLDKTNQQVVGMRFAGVAIPPGAVIQRASIQFQTDEVSSDVTSLTIRGEATSNAQTFIATKYDVTTRPRTTAAVAWAPAPWLTTGEAGPDQQTPDLASVIQEIVNGPGWSSGNALSIIIDGTGKRVAESYDGVASAAPRLHIEYLPGTVTPLAAYDATSTFVTSVTSQGLSNDTLGAPPASIVPVTQGANGRVAFDVTPGTTTYSLGWMDGSISLGTRRLRNGRADSSAVGEISAKLSTAPRRQTVRDAWIGCR